VFSSFGGEDLEGKNNVGMGKFLGEGGEL